MNIVDAVLLNTSRIGDQKKKKQEEEDEEISGIVTWKMNGS